MNNFRSIQDALINIMKITAAQLMIMVVLTTLASAGPSNGQGVLDSKVSLDVNNMEIKSILLEIEKQVPVNFTYRSKHIQASRKVSLNVNDARLIEVLDELFTPDVEFIALDK